MTEVRAPKQRTCERCGRTEVWADGSWQIAQSDGAPQIGSPFCIHEWDITGDFSPIKQAEG